MYTKILTVSAVNNYIKKIADSDFILSNANIKGEISNFKIHSSGHIYFSLKDEYSKINCIMFKNNTASINFTPEDGMKVIAKGKISVYEKEGTFQLYCSELKLEGIGELYAAFIKLKEKLQNEGMFDEKYKKQIPKMPKRIGVITSPTGAAIRDIINVAKRRNKNINMIIYPVLVQGISASDDIIKALNKLNNMDDVDVIILARGGGSLEELWAFNNEALAYAIFQSKKPIITGIGHETDFTIADFVSDRRAPTPSAAAEIAVQDLNYLNTALLNYRNSLKSKMENKLINSINETDKLKKLLLLNNPIKVVQNNFLLVNDKKEKLKYLMDSKIQLRKERLASLNALLSAQNPLNILNKGYSIIQDKDNNVISEMNVLKSINEVKVTLKDGSVIAKIKCN
ncbi:MAG: exodeoxyribonuclease VII large subunit [Bacillota bacterium]|nr:exodeoxyribonuclease VII large subunit [Bacillota bacterium]